ncbi:MAG TPA: hypothetical protein VIQ77_09780 [Mucilaginibacter sp.]
MKKVLIPITILLFFLSDTTLFADNRKDSVLKMADADIVINLDKTRPGFKIPDDFLGLSFETGSVRKNNANVKGYFFSPQNTQAKNIFKLLGIRNLRIGGGSVDLNQASPTFADIDQLFHFAKLLDIKIVYSLKLLNGSVDENVKIAKYVWSNYKDNLQCFAIGNEPDWDSYKKVDPEIKDYPTFLAKWRRMANAIVAEIPKAKFIGPDTGSNYPVPGAKKTYYMAKPWTVLFAEDLKASNLILYLAQHNYVGQDATRKTVSYLISNMLSADWVKIQYPTLLDSVLRPAVNKGYKYRLTESNSFSSAVPGGSNSNATALFALDYLHWWSQHGCPGINFHNKQWVLNAPVFMDANGSFKMAPICYGIKAFEISGKGITQPLQISNPGNINCTAYGVRDKNVLYITLINKEYGNSLRDACVDLKLGAKSNKAKYISLLSPHGNITELTGLKLGGSVLTNDGNWAPKWRTIENAVKGSLRIKVPAGSAMIVKIPY